ncbi:MAG: response regulator transcription factor [Ignavibacteriaceae bacterium]
MKLKILIVDDKVPFLDTVVKYLNLNKKIGLITWALNGSEAVTKIKKYNPDLILIDFSLPDINGLQLLREVKMNNNEQKIAVLTLHDDPEYRNEAKAAGADGFIAKTDFVELFPQLLEKIFPGY